VGLAREEALDLAAMRLVAHRLEARLGFGDNLGVALGVAELDQLDRLVDPVFDPAVGGDRPLQPGALAQKGLRRGRIIPKPATSGTARRSRPHAPARPPRRLPPRPRPAPAS